MGIIQIHVKCYDRFFEVLTDEIVDTELVVEKYGKPGTARLV